MKFKALIYFTLFLFFVGQPKIAHGQIEIFFDLLYELNVIFGLEGEPQAADTDFTIYPYDLYDDGRYRPVSEPGRNISAKAQLLLQTNDRDLFGGLAQIQFSPISIITLDLNHRQLFEGDNLSDAEQIAITNFTFQYNRLRYRQFNLWWDVGVSRYEEQGEAEGGISGGVGLSWFFKQPLSLHTSYRYHQFLDAGAQGLSSFNIRLQLHLNRYFISTGYQNLGNRISTNTLLVGGGVYF